MTRKVYLFEADFDDICEKIDGELSAASNKYLLPGRPGALTCIYQLPSTFSGKSVRVSIADGKKLREYLTPKWSKPSSPVGYNYERRDGWVSIEIIQMRPRSWPPRYLLIRVQLVLRRSAKNPAPKK